MFRNLASPSSIFIFSEQPDDRQAGYAKGSGSRAPPCVEHIPSTRVRREYPAAALIVRRPVRGPVKAATMHGRCGDLIGAFETSRAFISPPGRQDFVCA